MSDNLFDFEKGENLNNDDDFVIGKGFVIDDGKKKKGGHSRSKKSGGALKNVIWIVAIFVVSIGMAFGIIYAGADYLGIGFGRGENCVLDIPYGASTKVIAEKLEECGAVKIPFLFRTYSKLKHYDSQYKYGLYTFNNEAGYSTLADMLVTQGAKAETVTVTIPEATIDDIAKLLEENGVCTKSDFIDEVQNGTFEYDFVKEIPTESVHYRFEGYLLPDTYDFYSYDSKECAHLAVDTMLSALNKSITADMKKAISESKYSFHEVMTMASLVQLEAGNTKDVSDADRQKVAAVFYNRLESDDFATLGSSPTRKYPYGDGRYNTYECTGLPPGPLCSPNVPSIKAAIYPMENFDYFYFVTDLGNTNGGIPVFHYNRTLAEHNKIIAKLKAEKNWFYED